MATDPALVVAVSPNNSVAITAASLPLPTGAATSSNQTNGSQETQIVQGGNTAAVTAASALKVDGSAVTQPVSAASLPLPTGAATASNQTTLGTQTTELNDGTHTATIKAASTAAVAGDTALVVAVSPNNTPVLPSGAATSANQTNGSQETQIVQGGNTVTVTASSALKVDGSAVTQPVSAASLPLPTGAATASNQTTIGTQTTELNDGTHTATIKASTTPAATTDTSLVVALSPNSPIPTGSNVIGALTANQSVNLTEIGGTATVTGGVAGSLGVGGLAASGSAVAGDPVLVAGSDGTNARTLATSNTGNLITEYKPATTSSITSVAANAASVTLLVANTNRLMALITNDGTGVMFVALATTSSTTAYTYRVTSDSQVVIDGYWTGAISAIWTGANGSARITELTP